MSDQPNGTNVNGNGNGHNKGIFDLAPKADPLLSTIVPQARRRVCLMTRISEAARMFFCYLTDCSLLPGINTRKGVVKFSDNDLAARFKVDPKTIRNWKRAIEDTGEIWLTEKWMKNSFPQTVYNVTAIVGQATLPMDVDSNDGSLPEDEIFSSNRRRQQAAPRSNGTGKFVCRLHGQSGCPLCRRQTPPRGATPEVSAEILRNQAENDTAGKILPPTTAIDCRPPRQMVAAHHGNSLPSPTAIDCRPARQTVAAVGGNGLPLSTANGCRGERQTVADNGKTEVRESVLKRDGGSHPPPDEAFEKWRLGLKDQFPSHLRALEKKIRARLETARSETAKAGLRRQLKAVGDVLLPPMAEDAPAAVPSAVRVGPARLSPAERDALAKKIGPALRAAISPS